VAGTLIQETLFGDGRLKYRITQILLFEGRPFSSHLLITEFAFDSQQ
jgi:hypothetical protein